jgi:hypothetical protein
MTQALYAHMNNKKKKPDTNGPKCSAWKLIALGFDFQWTSTWQLVKSSALSSSWWQQQSAAVSTR